MCRAAQPPRLPAMTMTRKAPALAVWALLAVALLWPATSEGGPRLRTVLVADSAKPLPKAPLVSFRDCIGRPTSCANGAAGVVLAYSLKGRPPTKVTQATVLTDVNCEADRYGISHCLNELRLADGRRITVRHDHNMHMYPCLGPGERVRVVALAAFLSR